MQIVVFEDELLPQLDPVALSRPAFAISCGGYRLIDLLASLGQPIRGVVRPHLAAITKADFPALLFEGKPAADQLLAINARLVPSADVLKELRSMLAVGRPGIVRGPDNNSVAAALVDPGTLASAGGDWTSPAALARLPLEPLTANLPLLDYPHDIVRHHLATFSANLTHRLSGGGYSEVANGVFAAPGGMLGEHIVTNTSRGPIVLEAGATVGPFCYLAGPVHLGAAARVLEHASLKDAVAVGHTTKIGGEVEASIIEPYTNKQHHGFLGHSYLGSWINLGAGTCNSDLKNTYGTVNMEYRGQKVATGMQFIGAIVGDYVKTAINTGIFTGKTIGACSMVYGFVTTNVPSFVNYARLFSQVTEAPVEVQIAAQQRMFARRGVAQRPCDVQLLRDMHALTAHERKAIGESLSIEPLSL